MHSGHRSLPPMARFVNRQKSPNNKAMPAKRNHWCSSNNMPQPIKIRTISGDRNISTTISDINLNFFSVSCDGNRCMRKY